MMQTNQPPPFRGNKIIKAEAQGEAEVHQLIRRMKAGAFRVDGSIVLEMGGFICPVGWVEPAGSGRVKQIERFHLQPNGDFWPSVRMETEWDISGPVSLPDPIDEAIARLNVRFYRQDGKEAAIAYWFDASYHHLVLEWVANTRRLMICPAKPTLAEIQVLADSNRVTLELDQTGELSDFLKMVQPNKSGKIRGV